MPARTACAARSFYFDTVSVTGTENLMMAATLADGVTVLENAAREPEVRRSGQTCSTRWAHRSKGAGTDQIRIRGVSRLHGAEHSIIPDRIEAGTFLMAAAITGGELAVERCNSEHLAAVLAKLDEVGVQVDREIGDAADDSHTLTVKSGKRAARARLDHPGVPRLPHRHAGPVHGADDAGRGLVSHYRNDF